MTATDELRRLLDERGAEWRDDSSIYGTRRTVWTADGVTYVAAEVSGRLKVSGYLTPEQAIEATLGRWTCQLKRANWDDGTCTWGCICSACDAHLEHETGIGYNYCPHCGRKVVGA